MSGCENRIDCSQSGLSSVKTLSELGAVPSLVALLYQKLFELIQLCRGPPGQ